MSKLNNRLIERSKIQPKTKFIADGEGLYLRLEPSGTKTFCLRYTVAGSRKLKVLGTFPDMDIAAARKQASEMRELLEVHDSLPSASKEVDALTSPITVAQLATEWEMRYCRQRYKRPDKELHYLKSDIVPVIGQELVQNVTGRHVSLVIGKIVDRGARTKANRTLCVLKSLFGYAVEHGYIDATPVAMTKKGAGGAEKARSRVLNPKEIETLWHALDSRRRRMNWRTKALLKLILLTAQRPGECCGMRWEDVDLANGIWFLPAELTKSDRDHVVHLSHMAVSILKMAEKETGGSVYVFNSVVKGRDVATTVDALTRAVARMLANGEFGAMKRFTPHDLRRTASTGMANAGVYPHITEKILNHRMKGVLAVYNHGEYLPERKAAMELWGRLIEGWVGNLVGQVSEVGQMQLLL
ncbi:tyrosine-type recombinase/integrase [Cupriavidus taiwanensis]|uniref:Prophage INTEGRASE PROTEIN n=1 Tax=Cupriavidus taiwanensis (strain DSM 17343 / BCRC 17206 / CCUG 44338 / CIP 107171 / LMG 19424 / R1) TaxID=977880 RepID=B3R9I1_CUPTR|nr:site-specific integrase [Cupriavidus taiwanensis]CAQ71556.1 prophage INTEGRASE PROTEIN [Cupriavidus taiwanensis LMG 19424]